MGKGRAGGTRAQGDGTLWVNPEGSVDAAVGARRLRPTTVMNATEFSCWTQQASQVETSVCHTYNYDLRRSHPEVQLISRLFEF